VRARYPMKTSDVQRDVQRLFDQLIDENNERGLQTAVYYRGELVVNVAAGRSSATTDAPVTPETLFPVFSCGKGVTATIIHRLVERGVLDYGQRIAELWPEFSVNGKESVTLRHVLDHSAGLHLVPNGIGDDGVGDWASVCAKIAAMSPAWTPGSQREYHAITQGWILGETACRATGNTFEQLLDAEIREPLGLKNTYMGIPDEVEPRVAELEEVGPAVDFPAVDYAQAIPNWVQPLYAWMNRPEVRRACVPASNGIMTAGDLARHYAALCPGGVDGVELLTSRRMSLALEPADPSVPTTMGPRGLGYGLGEPGAAMGSRPACFGHGGHGGLLGFADRDHRLAVGFVRNRLRDPSGVDTVRLLLEIVRRGLNAEDRG
jgi:CubicO group peptidase (beta-lactamase class C family)